MKEQLLIFNNGEGVVDERPTKLNDTEISEINIKVAKDIIREFDLHDGGDMDTLLEEVLEDVENMDFNCDGYEIAKEFEDLGYEINARAVEYLDSVYVDYDNALRDKVKRWVKIKNLLPVCEIGTKFVPTNKLKRQLAGRRFQKECYYIVGYNRAEGKYILNEDKNSEFGSVLTYEFVENADNFELLS